MNIRELNVFQKSDQLIKESFRDFLNQPNDYKNKFLQSQYKTAFDGYSFLGQTDSLNQYDTDLLFSFVLSEFQPTANFPKEFKEFLNSYSEVTGSNLYKGSLEDIHNSNFLISVGSYLKSDAPNVKYAFNNVAKFIALFGKTGVDIQACLTLAGCSFFS